MGVEARKDFKLVRFPWKKVQPPRIPQAVQARDCEAVISTIEPRGEKFLVKAECNAQGCDLGKAEIFRDTIGDAKLLRSQIFDLKCPLLEGKLIDVIPQDKIPEDFRGRPPADQPLSNS